MAFNPNSPLNIGGKGVQGGLPTASQILQFNAVTNRWEFAAPPSGTSNTFARVVKKVDEIVNNSTTLINDAELFVALNINKTYGFYFIMFLSSPATPQIKKLWSIPAGATGLRLNGAWSSSAVISTRNVITSSALATNGQDQSLVESGRIIMAGTAGNLQFRWAQQTANASDTKVLQGSYLVVWEELP